MDQRIMHGVIYGTERVEIVRYVRAGKYYVEYPDRAPVRGRIVREQVPISEAVRRLIRGGQDYGHRAAWFARKTGGNAFDAKMARAMKAPDAPVFLRKVEP